MNYQKIFRQIIVTTRIRSSGVGEKRNLQDEVLSDKARIITCSAFRRLQDKAQVFSLERNAAVRTRLTHSMEVAMNGELIAGKVFEKLKRKSLIEEELRLPFIVTVQNACLLHDLGNPPFGHFGEFAIQTWINKNTPTVLKIFKAAKIPLKKYQPFLDSYKAFDGNPQGFRIITRLQRKDDRLGLNLTVGLLAASMKYLDYKPHDKGEFFKKPGFFFSEIDLVKKIRSTLTLNTDQRHPLAYIMEASDDISFCLSDIEDAIEKKITTAEIFFKHVNSKLKGNAKRWHTKTFKDTAKYLDSHPTTQFIDYKTRCTRYFVEAASENFVNSIDDIMTGKADNLFSDSISRELQSAFKSFATEYIFPSQEALDIELVGYSVITGLLDKLFILAQLPTKEFERILLKNVKKHEYPLEKRLVSILPKRQLLYYQETVKENPNLEPIYRLQLIIDYIAGMTDSHALKVFHILTGQKAEVR